MVRMTDTTLINTVFNSIKVLEIKTFGRQIFHINPSKLFLLKLSQIPILL